mmetsp:Transcript_57426/g.116940  ORF Transcript_57426/g.116940 Transcript_57426/m.116940 type:complete len:124 (+) Transcript_57426:1-372(+)
MVIEEIDDEPGQDERLGPGDCICKINGQSLQEMEDCESVFIDFLKDGVEIEVEPKCHASGAVPQSGAVDWNALEADLKSFGGDYQVDFKLSPDKRQLRMSGPRAAVLAAREDATQVLATYFPA